MDRPREEDEDEDEFAKSSYSTFIRHQCTKVVGWCYVTNAKIDLPGSREEPGPEYIPVWINADHSKGERERIGLVQRH